MITPEGILRMVREHHVRLRRDERGAWVGACMGVPIFAANALSFALHRRPFELAFSIFGFVACLSGYGAAITTLRRVRDERRTAENLLAAAEAPGARMRISVRSNAGTN